MPRDHPPVIGLAVAHDLTRDGLVLMLAEAGARVRPGPVELDRAAPASVAGLDVLVVAIGTDPEAAVRAAAGDLRVVALHDGLSTRSQRALRAAGVVAVDAASSPEAIVAAIAGSSDRPVRRWVPPAVGDAPLSERERSVLGLVAQGRTASEVAERLGISANTVENHKAAAFRKLMATNQAQAVANALRTGQLDADGTATLPPDETALAAPADVGIAVAGTRPLMVRSIERLLDARGAYVRGIEAAPRVAVAVLVEPGEREWEQVELAHVPVVVLTDHEPSGADLLGLASRGTHAVLPLGCSTEHLLHTAVRVARGDSGFTRAQTRQLVDALRGRVVEQREAAPKVTPREHEILETLDRGLSVKQAATELGISPRTVENTRRVLYRKLGVRNRAEAVALAYARGVLGPGSPRPPRQSRTP